MNSPYACFLIFLNCLLLYSCSWHPNTIAYRTQYSYLNQNVSLYPTMKESDHFLVILVNARHLDYTDTAGLLQTIVKHPNDGSKNGDVGHAWIHMQGVVNGKVVSVEGGHSGELGRLQPKYFDGVMNYIDYGCANPQAAIRVNCEEPNPIKYLWETLCDGFFQEGSGGHIPNFAAKIDITPAQFNDILAFIQHGYHYGKYSITKHQCASFVAEVAALADFPIEYKTTVLIDQIIKFRGRKLKLWEDPLYSKLCIGSPDIIEHSLVESVQQGKAEYALPWYRKTICNKKMNVP